ncbi:MAG: SCP-2 sterol transfer family protein [Moraxellaceae bacterium]|nr:SCP-2 sterol transfer family protein [Moraxellaceae bacterium]
MKLKMLLWYMARRMELLARTHPEFIARLHGRDFTLQISSDEGTQRFFRVRHNRVVSRNAAHSTPSMTLHFASDEIGFNVLSSTDKAAFMTAMQTGDVKVIGDFSLLMWFMSIAPYMRPHRRKPQTREAAA